MPIHEVLALSLLASYIGDQVGPSFLLLRGAAKAPSPIRVPVRLGRPMAIVMHLHTFNRLSANPDRSGVTSFVICRRGTLIKWL
jgi:hypothetical protein